MAENVGEDTRETEKLGDSTGVPVVKAEPGESAPSNRGAESGEVPRANKTEAEQGGESSGNNASNGTTQKLEKTEEAAAEASTTPKPPADDLQELASRGLCAPLWRTTKPSQSGVAASDVQELQTGWCNYNGHANVQKCATWLAASSPSVQARLSQHQTLQGGMPASFGVSQNNMAMTSFAAPSTSHPAVKKQQPEYKQQRDKVFSAQPPSTALPALPPSPFSKTTVTPFAAGLGEGAANLNNAVSGDSPFTPSTQTKFQWPEDAHSPRQSIAEGIQENPQRQEARTGSITRQASLPDFGELADLWAEMSTVPDDYALDLEAIPFPRDNSTGPLPTLPSQASLGLRQSSLARLRDKAQEANVPVGSLLNDIKSQRRIRGSKITSALTWQPGLELEPPTPAVPRRNSGRLQGMQLGAANPPAVDRSGSSGFNSSAEAGRARGPDLPEQVQLSISSAPSIFQVPTCINKTFKPAFTLRVTVISARPTQIKATVAAYTLQREQVAKLEQWHPSQHIFTESLSGSIETQSIICEGPTNTLTGERFPGKHVGIGELHFNDLKFNSSSRMKPRWLVFALALPTDDVIFVQYTVPTIVMSRQCDQTPRALAILRGEVPTRKRARQNDTVDPPRTRMAPFPGVTTMTPLASPSSLGPSMIAGFMQSPGLSSRHHFQPQDQESMTVGNLYGEEEWPQLGPYTMPRWREAIVKVCREHGLTRSFEQEDMHELAKVAGFMGTPQNGNQQTAALTIQQWNAFGKWFLSQLSVLRDHTDLWMCPTVLCICGFSATREHAEHVLSAQPEGTFLLRPSLSMESTIVISLMTASGRICHLAIDHVQLENRPIEDWVVELPELVYLLDVNTGIRYPKTQIFRKRRHSPLAPGSFMNSMMGPPPRGQNGGLIPPMAPQGADALAHILDASRRGTDGYGGQHHLGQFQHQGMQLGQMPVLSMPGMGRGHELLYDSWAQADARDPFRGFQMHHMDAGPMLQGKHGSMRFGGH